MRVLLDAGHGEDTPGKQSPDGKLREYSWNRQMAARIAEGLKKAGIAVTLLVPETTDIPLSVRAARANEWCRREGKENVILISVHVNAAGCGSWMKARGWSAYTSPGKTKADLLAESLYGAACELLPPGIPIRTDLSDGDRDWEARFAILMKTQCPAVLTENLFMDNREDLAILLSEDGQRRLAEIHVQGILSYLRS